MHAYSELPEDKIRIICEAKRNGKTDAFAASEAHITPRTMFSWIVKGARGQEPFTSFVKQYRDAIDEYAKNRLAALRIEYESRKTHRTVVSDG